MVPVHTGTILTFLRQLIDGVNEINKFYNAICINFFFYLITLSILKKKHKEFSSVKVTIDFELNISKNDSLNATKTRHANSRQPTLKP